jgi:hypothetical protein
MSRSEIRANLCAGKIGIDSSIQAQGTGEVMSQNWRIYCLFDSNIGTHMDHPVLTIKGDDFPRISLSQSCQQLVVKIKSWCCHAEVL